jgi:hypothetical protein
MEVQDRVATSLTLAPDLLLTQVAFPSHVLVEARPVPIKLKGRGKGKGKASVPPVPEERVGEEGEAGEEAGAGYILRGRAVPSFP